MEQDRCRELSFCINLIGLALTRSRFGIAFFAAAVLVALCFQFKWIIYLSGAALLLCMTGTVFLFATGREGIIMGTTLVSRLIYWQDGLGLWLHNLLGIGAGAWENRQYAIQTTGCCKIVKMHILQQLFSCKRTL